MTGYTPLPVKRNTTGASIRQRIRAEFVVIVNAMQDDLVTTAGSFGPLCRNGFAAGDHVKGKLAFASPSVFGM